jgi:hypothetical protein
VKSGKRNAAAADAGAVGAAGAAATGLVSAWLDEEQAIRNRGKTNELSAFLRVWFLCMHFSMSLFSQYNQISTNDTKTIKFHESFRREQGFAGATNSFTSAAQSWQACG